MGRIVLRIKDFLLVRIAFAVPIRGLVYRTILRQLIQSAVAPFISCPTVVIFRFDLAPGVIITITFRRRGAQVAFRPIDTQTQIDGSRRYDFLHADVAFCFDHAFTAQGVNGNDRIAFAGGFEST